MKKLVLGFLLGVTVVGLFLATFAFGQVVGARSFMLFTPIDIYNKDGAVSPERKLAVGEILMPNGVTCYVVSDRPGPFSIENMTQLVGLGCLKE